MNAQGPALDDMNSTEGSDSPSLRSSNLGSNSPRSSKTSHANFEPDDTIKGDNPSKEAPQDEQDVDTGAKQPDISQYIRPSHISDLNSSTSVSEPDETPNGVSIPASALGSPRFPKHEQDELSLHLFDKLNLLTVERSDGVKEECIQVWCDHLPSKHPALSVQQITNKFVSGDENYMEPPNLPNCILIPTRSIKNLKTNFVTKTSGYLSPIAKFVEEVKCERTHQIEELERAAKQAETDEHFRKEREKIFYACLMVLSLVIVNQVRSVSDALMILPVFIPIFNVVPAMISSAVRLLYYFRGSHISTPSEFDAPSRQPPEPRARLTATSLTAATHGPTSEWTVKAPQQEGVRPQPAYINAYLKGPKLWLNLITFPAVASYFDRKWLMIVTAMLVAIFGIVAVTMIGYKPIIVWLKRRAESRRIVTGFQGQSDAAASKNTRSQKKASTLTYDIIVRLVIFLESAHRFLLTAQRHFKGTYFSTAQFIDKHQSALAILAFLTACLTDYMLGLGLITGLSDVAVALGASIPYVHSSRPQINLAAWYPNISYIIPAIVISVCLYRYFFAAVYFLCNKVADVFEAIGFLLCQLLYILVLYSPDLADVTLSGKKAVSERAWKREWKWIVRYIVGLVLATAWLAGTICLGIWTFYWWKGPLPVLDMIVKYSDGEEGPRVRVMQ